MDNKTEITNINKFKTCTDFIVYYGTGNEQILSNFQISIVEPKGQDEDSIERIKASGTLLIAYVSVMEIHSDSREFALLSDDDFLKLNGEKEMNKDYGTYLIDLESIRWQSMLIHHIGNLIYHQNYDGVFLDTIGDVEFGVIPQHKQNMLINASLRLIKEIKDIFEDIIVIQNNGLEKLCSITADVIDGICWENPPLLLEESRGWVDAVSRELFYLKENKRLQVMVLVEGQEDNEDYLIAAEELCKEKGFLFYKATYRYI